MYDRRTQVGCLMQLQYLFEEGKPMFCSDYSLTNPATFFFLGLLIQEHCHHCNLKPKPAQMAMISALKTSFVYLKIDHCAIVPYCW
jgi:hypothetical protein